MMGWIAALCLLGATGILAALAVIDLKTWLLPNVLTLPLALLAPLFHFTTGFHYVSLEGIALGGALGFGTLYVIRHFANKAYKTDSLGLGDVKLLGAGGMWLGGEMVMMAMSIGAFASVLHGIAYAVIHAHKTKTPINLRRLKIPAGPGFTLGIFLVGVWVFKDFRPF
jgi:leader peptidase (prepilin peptidase)/N-methyltransferase